MRKKTYLTAAWMLGGVKGQEGENTTYPEKNWKVEDKNRKQSCSVNY